MRLTSDSRDTADLARAFASYRQVRDAVVRIASARCDAAAPSDYWAEELENIDYMVDASPLIIRKLRHHAFQITGIRPYDYRIQDDTRREAFAQRLQALIQLGGPELVVPEHEALGGFGYEFPEGRFNVDTLKFLEVLVGMKRGGALDALRSDRPTVVEIGAGWGGFAYQIKTLFPRTRYVIVDFPELFLFSATYLSAVFPDARVVILEAGTDMPEAADADFVFIPHTCAARAAEFAPNLTVNMISFQEMTSQQVTEYARLAHTSGCSLLYSLNRERSRYNLQLTSVSDRLAPYYDLERIEVLDTPYTAAFRKSTKPGRAKAPVPDDEFTYRHFVGRRRERPLAEESPVVAFGVTSYNRATHLRESLDSLLAQTHSEFRLVLVDDASSDGTDAIAREYAARDTRVEYIRHDERQGMAATWRHAFEAATADPRVRYFAWASDHDVWDAQWLERLVRELDAHPEAVLAYPRSRRIDEHGRLLAKPARLFETAGMADVDARWRFVSVELSASGDMVYGLVRVPAMRRAGVFRDVLCPDRLLMAELSLAGEIRQVPEDLWRRRQFAEGSVKRQRRSLFAGRAPAGRRMPVWWQHGRAMWDAYVAPEVDPVKRRIASRRVVRYCAGYALRHYQKGAAHKTLAALIAITRGAYKRAKHLVLLAVFYTLVYSRRGYHRLVYEVAILTRRMGLR